MLTIDNQLKKGVLSIIILKLISERDMYGYEIIQLLDNSSGGYYKLKEGTLYPILYRLEDNGWIESYRIIKDEERRVPRKYYKITNNGIKALKDQLILWRHFDDITNKILNFNYGGLV